MITIDDQDWKILEGLIQKEILRINQLPIPDVDKEILSERYRMVLEHINDSSTSVAKNYEKAKSDRDLRKKEEKQRNQLHVVANPIQTECIRNGANLEVVEKVVNKTEAKTQYSKELLEFKWKSLNEKTRSILKEVLLYHAESADGTIASCFKVIIKNPMYDFSKLSTFWKTIYSNLAYRREYLVDYGYLKKRYDEGKVDSFYLTPLGEEVVKRLRSGVLQIPDVRTFAPKD